MSTLKTLRPAGSVTAYTEVARGTSASSSARAISGIVCFFFLVYVLSMFTPSIFDDADATHAEAAREMAASGDFVTLHVNGIRYLEKAPLLYWMVAGSYKLFGVTAFSTRLPIALTILATIVLAIAWGRQAFGRRAGIYAGLFVCCTAGYFLFTRILIPDVILSLLIALAFYFHLTALEPTAGTWRWYAGYAAVALAVLTKGLVALVLVGTTVAGYLLITGEWRRWREFRLISGFALMFAIAAPWHILAGMRNHGFFWFYFVNEHWLRFLGKRFPKDYNKLPTALYWSLHLVWLFPWSAYLPIAFRNICRDLQPSMQVGFGGKSAFAARTKILCWVWAGVVLTFFAFSTNQEYYTFPAYFAFVLLLASALAREEQPHRNSRWLMWATAALAAISVIAGLALVAGLWSSRSLPFVPDIGTVLSHNIGENTLSMSHMLDLTGKSFAALRLPSFLAAIAFLAAPLASLVLRARKRHYAATWTIASGMALLLFAAHIALVRFEPYLSSKVLAQGIAASARPGDRVMIYGDQAFGSSLLWNLRRPIELVNGRSTSMLFGSNYPDAPKIFLDDDDLRKSWTEGKRVFLFVPPHLRTRINDLGLTPKYLIGESSDKVIYSNVR